jgi:hypothetical protein
MHSQEDLRSFIQLALRHSCKVRRVSSSHVDRVIQQLSPSAMSDALVRAIVEVACPTHGNVVDIRRPVLMRKVAKLLSDCLTLRQAWSQ